MSSQSQDRWTSGDAYENFMGRWSPRLAAEFLGWLDVPSGKNWLDVGCGTGALARTILAQAAPAKVLGVDPSEKFIAFDRQNANDARVQFEVGSAQSLPVEPGSFDVVVSGLVLNFIPNAAEAMEQMKHALRAGGTLSAYVWDYAEGMRMLRHFWDAAIALERRVASSAEGLLAIRGGLKTAPNPAAAEQDEGRRFPLCHPEALAGLFSEAGLQEVETRALEFTMEFRDFDDYWQPFRGVQGPAPGYLDGLPPEKQEALEAELRKRLPAASDGSIALTARAWAVKGRLEG